MPLLPTLVMAIESPVGIWAFIRVGAESLVLIIGPGFLWLPNTSPNIIPLGRTNKYTLSPTPTSVMSMYQGTVGGISNTTP